MAGSGAYRIPLFDLDYSEEEKEAVLEVINSRWVSAGPKVREFEEKFAGLIGVKHAVAVANGSAALHLAYLAVGLGPGDEVIVPSNTFVATVSMVLHTGATPVFADIESVKRPNLSPETVEKAITERTKAVVFVHYAGFTDNAIEIREICDRHGILMIEDAAHAHGARAGEKMAGGIGHIAAFSFYSNKNLATGEGGMVTTDDDELARRVRLLRSHGMTSLSWERYTSISRPAGYDVVLPGFNYRMTELHAALGLVQLRKLGVKNERRRELVSHYRRLLRERLQGVVECPFDSIEQSSHYIIPVLLAPHLDRDEVALKMAGEGIQTSVHYHPVHLFSYFRKSFPDVELPVTEDFGRRELTLPLYPSMSFDDVELVVETLKRSIEDFEKS